MSTKSKSKMFQLNIEYTGLKRAKFDMMVNRTQEFLAELLNSHPRGDECIVRSNWPPHPDHNNLPNYQATFLVIIPDDAVVKVRQIAKSCGGKVVLEQEHHRTPYDKVAEALKAQGYTEVAKYTDEKNRQFRVYQSPGRPTLLAHLPTFKVFTIRELDLGIDNAKK